MTASANLYVPAALSATYHIKKRDVPSWFTRLVAAEQLSWRSIRNLSVQPCYHLSERATLVFEDAFAWLDRLPANSIHAVVTDPPYGVIEYEQKNQDKLRKGRGGVWRIPPSFDGSKRNPLPRFTILSKEDISSLQDFFGKLAQRLLESLVPGGHVFIASNPLLSTHTFHTFIDAGFEKRGEVIRLVQTLRGGDRPKGAELDFEDVTVMPRSCWEPWGIFRKPFKGTVAENLKRWGAGGLRRVSDDQPFKDVIRCAPTRGSEKRFAPHPSLKPQSLLRKLVRASLPLGVGIIYDPFAGSSSTLAAADAAGHLAIGTEIDKHFVDLARKAFYPLRSLQVSE